MNLKHFLLFILALTYSIANARAGAALAEIRSASGDVLVAFFRGDSGDVNEVDIGDKTLWKINGEPAVLALERVR